MYYKKNNLYYSNINILKKVLTSLVVKQDTSNI